METGTKTFYSMCRKEGRNCSVFAHATVSIVKDRKSVFLDKKYTFINLFANNAIRKIQ